VGDSQLPQLPGLLLPPPLGQGEGADGCTTGRSLARALLRP
jgi:hypothetical protein